jgi:hypothetical protein
VPMQLIATNAVTSGEAKQGLDLNSVQQQKTTFAITDNMVCCV